MTTDVTISTADDQAMLSPKPGPGQPRVYTVNPGIVGGSPSIRQKHSRG